MKKIFTLIAAAFVTLSASAQNIKDTDPTHLYPIKEITWGAIVWKNDKNQKDKDNKDMLFLMGTGNGYSQIMAEEIYNESGPTGTYRPCYGYIDYENGETGAPAYGLYYKFTPSASGKLKMNVWMNKGRRKVFVVKGSTGTPLSYGTDYEFEGYINGENTTEGEVTHPTYFSEAEFKAYRAEKATTDAGITAYVITPGDKATWGWLNINVEANESYYVYMQSSQLGFGGFEFNGQSYSACNADKSLAAEFAAVVDAEGKATNVNEKGSVVTFTAAGVAVEAVGGATPTAVVPDLEAAGINTVKTEQNADTPIYNLSGQKVDKSYKGIVIQNGRKFVNK